MGHWKLTNYNNTTIQTRKHRWQRKKNNKHTNCNQTEENRIRTLKLTIFRWVDSEVIKFCKYFHAATFYMIVCWFASNDLFVNSNWERTQLRTWIVWIASPVTAKSPDFLFDFFNIVFLYIYFSLNYLLFIVCDIVEILLSFTTTTVTTMRLSIFFTFFILSCSFLPSYSIQFYLRQGEETCLR